MLKTLVPKFRPDLSVRSRDIAEKPVPAKLKPIVEFLCLVNSPFQCLHNFSVGVEVGEDGGECVSLVEKFAGDCCPQYFSSAHIEIFAFQTVE